MAVITLLERIKSVGLRGSADQSNERDAPDRASLTGVVHALIAEHRLPASGGADQPGFFLAIEGRDELSVQYNDPAIDAGSAFCGRVRREAADGLFRCSAALSRSGYSVTVIASPRTLAMFVRPA